MPRITPVAAVPTGAGSDPTSYLAANASDPPKVLRLQGGDAVDVTHEAVNAAVGLRPYFWEDVAGLASPGGRWVALGSDGTSGSSASVADPTKYNKCAHGRFQDCVSGGRHWILHVDSGLLANSVWAKIEAGNRSSA